MDEIFDTIINSYIDHQVGIATGFLSPALALHLKDNLTALYADSRLQAAGTGNCPFSSKA